MPRVVYLSASERETFLNSFPAARVATRRECIEASVMQHMHKAYYRRRRKQTLEYFKYGKASKYALKYLE